MSRLVPRFAFLILALAATAIAGLATAQDRVIDSNVSIRQDNLNNGTYTVNKVVQAGRQFFAVSFLPADGHGEGVNGPRSQQRVALWPDVPGVAEPYIPFLRLNGLDSQSCFACHNTSGTYVPPGELHATQKPGPVGGAGDFASVLFGNETFPQPLTHVVRVPPRAFGSAYLQELALEMTRELLKIERNLTNQAAQSPGTPLTANLVAKGVDFGALTITCGNASCSPKNRDTSAVDGISPDLIVRPLQNKGIAATVRSFTKTALDFHHSMQPVEVVGINTDCDQDGLINELAVNNTAAASGAGSVQVQQSLGNVAALTAFTGMLRPPIKAPSGATTDPDGETLFAQIGCADCHTPTLTTRANPQFRIELAEPADGCPNGPGYGLIPKLGEFAEADGDIHPARKAAEEEDVIDDEEAAARRGLEEGGEVLEPQVRRCPTGFYCIDLTNPGNLPPEFFGRLPKNKNGTVTVPLYSDLKRHDMGQYLAQSNPPQADDKGNTIPNRDWLTQKLWGVRDNGPWLHDGRARTLNEAILMHSGPDGLATDSDASPVIANYLSLTAVQRQKVVDFLERLTIPNP